MSIEFKPAVKIIKPLKVCIYGPTASGKTYSSLLLANGFVQTKRKCTEAEAWKHIAIADTESGRGSMYSGFGDYLVATIEAPYTVDKYVDVVKAVNANDDIDVLIIDSFTHFWSKEGGLLDQKTQLDTLGGNGFTNWNVIGKQFNDMVSLGLNSSKYVIFTCRSKSDTVLTIDGKGKTVPKTYGLKPDMREGFEYECDILFNIDKEDHSLLVEKGITGMKATYDKATPELGKELLHLMSDNTLNPIRTTKDICNDIRALCKNEKELIELVQTNTSGKKLEELDETTLLGIEKGLKNAIKKKQNSKSNASK